MMVMLSPCPSRPDLAGGVPWPSAVRSWLAAMLLACLMSGRVLAGPLEVLATDPLGWLGLRSSDATNRVQTLQVSGDLATWKEAAVFHGGSFEFRDPAAPTQTVRFYRVASRSKTSADDGRNQLQAVDDPFLVRPIAGLFENPIHWAKFTILREDSTRVWFQDSQRYRFHHDYARLRLKPFLGMSRAEFDLSTLQASNHLAVLGAVLVPGDGRPEYGIQIVGQ